MSWPCTAADEAVQRARAGSGPTLIECRTYRTRSHAEGMRDVGYRTQAEVDEWKVRDPLTLLESRMLAENTAVASDFDAIETEIKTMVDEAVEFAKASPWPDPATATRYIFSEGGHAHA